MEVVRITPPTGDATVEATLALIGEPRVEELRFREGNSWTTGTITSIDYAVESVREDGATERVWPVSYVASITVTTSHGRSRNGRMPRRCDHEEGNHPAGRDRLADQPPTPRTMVVVTGRVLVG